MSTARLTRNMRLALEALRGGAYASSLGWYVDFVYPDRPSQTLPGYPLRLIRIPDGDSGALITETTMDALERRGLVTRTRNRGSIRWQLPTTLTEET